MPRGIIIMRVGLTLLRPVDSIVGASYQAYVSVVSAQHRHMEIKHKTTRSTRVKQVSSAPCMWLLGFAPWYWMLLLVVAGKLPSISPK